jgi:hypothetical protein
MHTAIVSAISLSCNVDKAKFVVVKQYFFGDCLRR